MLRLNSRPKINNILVAFDNQRQFHLNTTRRFKDVKY